MKKKDRIIIIDFGSQYTQLIARRVREIGVYSEVISPSLSLNRIIEMNPLGIILSGGPETVTSNTAPKVDNNLFSFRYSNFRNLLWNANISKRIRRRSIHMQILENLDMLQYL